MADTNTSTPRIYLARHGETEWTINGRYTGVTDLDLTKNGVKQVQGTGKMLIGEGKLIDPSKLIKVFVSPRKRAQTTFDLLFAKEEKDRLSKAGRIEVTDEIAEWGYGEYEGLVTSQIREKRKEQGLDQERPWDIWRDGCEDGEVPQQVTNRLDSLIEKIRNLQVPYMHGEAPANIVLVAHGHILRAFAKRWLRYSMETPLSMMMEPGAIGILRRSSSPFGFDNPHQQPLGQSWLGSAFPKVRFDIRRKCLSKDLQLIEDILSAGQDLAQMASAGGDAAAISSTENNGPTPRYKSFKKKYMKIRKQFSDTMIKNNTQWEAEQKLMKTARRLEEELDQLREILVDVNESSFNPAHLRINLRSSNPEEDAFLASMGATSLPPDDFDILDNNTKYSPESAALVLAEAKKELSSGTITTSDFEALATSVQPYLRKSIALSYLETQVAHTRLADVEPSDLPPDIGEANPVGYLTPEHEAEYLERLDAELDGRAAAYSHPIRGPTLNAARDNPMSALNWLRQNQPQVFLQDSEAQETAKQMKRGSHDGPIKERSSGRGKRGSVAHEVLDDEGFVVGAAAETLGSVRGKRKRAAEDDAYNPKGGGGRRKGKKQSLGAEHD